MTKTAVYYLVAALSVFVIDQVTKSWALENSTASINSGIAFGLLADARWLGWVVPLVLLGLASVWMWRFVSLYPITTGLFLGAAVSNFVDRWRYGGVVDWLPVPVVALQNNIADWVIVGTLAVLTVQVVRSQKKQLV